MNRHYGLRHTCGAAALATAFILSPQALAQAPSTQTATANTPDSDAQLDDAQLEDIVVVAEKRAENLQDVPIAVTAVSGEDLAARGAISTKDLQNIVPGLVFTQNLPAGNPYLRGVGQNSGSVGIESPV